MSQEANRVWTACVRGCAALAAVGLVAGWLVWQGGVRPAVAAEPAAGPGGVTLLDPVKHAGVSELRGRVRLSDDTLAAMACSQASAETILGKLPTWWETNRVAWLARREAVSGARARLRRAERTARTKIRGHHTDYMSDRGLGVHVGRTLAQARREGLRIDDASAREHRPAAG